MTRPCVGSGRPPQGDAGGQCSLGVKYINGQGVVQDHAEVVRWYRKTAEHGLVNAVSTLKRLSAGAVTSNASPPLNVQGNSSSDWARVLQLWNRRERRWCCPQALLAVQGRFLLREGVPGPALEGEGSQGGL